MGDDLLGPQRDCNRVLTGERVSFVKRIGVQRLSAAQHGRHGLQRGTYDVVAWLLPGERASSGLGVEAKLQAALGLGAEAVAHEQRPDLPCGSILGYLLEEIVMGIEEETQARGELVDLEPAL